MKNAAQFRQNFISSTTCDKSKIGSKVKAVELEQLKNLKHGNVILGIADDTGIKNVHGRIGAKEGPSAIRDRLFKFTCSELTIPIYDLGDLLPSNTIEETHLRALETIEQIHQTGHFPIILGGGHDLAYPEALALLKTRKKKQACGFLNIDAHLDLRDTTDGITSGSPWYLLTQNPLFHQSKSKLIEFGIQAHCNASHLIDYANHNNIDIHWFGKTAKERFATFKSLIAKLKKYKNNLMSLDIDSLSYRDAPGCSAPQTIGFSIDEILTYCLHAGAQKHIHSFGIYEVSPPLDPNHQTAQAAAHCILSFLVGREKSLQVNIKRWTARKRK